MNRIELSKVLAKVAFGMAPNKRVFVDAVLALNITDAVRKELTAMNTTELVLMESRKMPAGYYKDRQVIHVPWSYLVRVVEWADRGKNIEQFSDQFLDHLRRYVATIQLRKEHIPCPPPLPPILSESVLHPDGGRKNATPPPTIPPPSLNGSLK